MKRLIVGASLVTIVTSAALANPTSASHSASKAPPPLHVLAFKVAPADEYFGHLKMSILGIRNTIKDEGLKLDVDTARGADIVHACAYTEDALHDWEKKYPRDNWLPRTVFTLERLYAKVDTDEARSKARTTMVWLVRDFPRSPEAKAGKIELAQNKVGVKPPAAPDEASAVPSPAANPVLAPLPAATP